MISGPAIRRSSLLALVLLAACARPRDTLVPISDIRAIPKIDMHAHYTGEPEKLIPVLEAWNMRAVLIGVMSDTADHPRRWAGMRELHRQHPGRFYLGASFNPFYFNNPDFAEKAIATLQTEIDRGARIVKVWKNIGMGVKDREGNYVQIDHPRFQPIWDFLVQRGIPVIAHIAEPIDAWEPLDPASPHFSYYSGHPEYHAYVHPEIPRHETIIAARDRWIARNPRLVIVGAHIGSLERNVDDVARRLDAYPNFHVETAARINNLGMQSSEKVRDFMIRYQDRIMWGTDYGEGTIDRIGPLFEQHWRYFAGADTTMLGSAQGWNRRMPGLGLPRSVLEKFYYRNAERILRVDE